MKPYKRKTPLKTSFTAVAFIRHETAEKIKALLINRKGERMKLYQKIFDIGVANLIIEKQKEKEQMSKKKSQGGKKGRRKG